MVLGAVALSGCGDGLVTPDPGPLTPTSAQTEGSGAAGDIGIRLPGPMPGCIDFPGGLFNEVFPIAVETVALYDESRDRDVPVDVFLPAPAGPVPPVFGRGPFPVVVFSHGGSSYDRRDYTADEDPIFPEFTQYWTSKGYVVLAPRHPRLPGYEWSQPERTTDVRFTLDHAFQLVRAVDPDMFIDLQSPVVAGFSIGATTAVLVAGVTLPADPRDGSFVDFSDDRFGSALLLTGAPSEIEGNTWWHPDWSGLTIPVLTLVGSEDYDNEPGTVPEDFLDVVRDSPPGGKHGVMVMGAGHHLGARPWDPPEELEASQTASVLFLRAYADPPNEPAVATLAHHSFCGIVARDLVQVEFHDAPVLASEWP